MKPAGRLSGRVVRPAAAGLAVLLLLAGCSGPAPEGTESASATAAATTAASSAGLPATAGLSAAAGITEEGLVLDVPLLRQSDPRWSEVPLGTAGAVIGSEGCALTSFAMVASCLGTPITPVQALERLAEYAYPVEWMAGESRYGLHVLRKDSVRFRDSRLHDADYVRDTIEDCLAAGYPVIIGILQVSTGTPHFIVAYGLERTEDGFRILVRDPSLNSDYERFEDIPAGWMVTRLVVYQP